MLGRDTDRKTEKKRRKCDRKKERKEKQKGKKINNNKKRNHISCPPSIDDFILFSEPAPRTTEPPGLPGETQIV